MTFKEALESKAEFNSLDELLESEELNVFLEGLNDPKNFPQNEEPNTVEDKDLDDFEDLDTHLNSKEFEDLYNKAPEPRPVSVHDNKGMTIEDISGFPTPEREQWEYK